MIIFYAIAGVTLAGIGFVLWSLKSDTEDQNPPAKHIRPEDVIGEGLLEAKTKTVKQPASFLKFPSFNKDPQKKSDSNNDFSANKKESKPSLIVNLLKKIGLGRVDPALTDIPEVSPLPNLKNLMEPEKKTKENPVSSHIPAVGTLSVTTRQEPTTIPQEKKLTAQDEKAIEREINLSAELSEWKQKNEKLESLLKEKNEELDKAQKALDNELRNRKDFNKVKDILEKEIKEMKDKNKDIQGELISTKSENESYKKRISQLEEKATKLEKEILVKENEIDNLAKRLQVFASSTTSITPPIKNPVLEAPQEELTSKETTDTMPQANMEQAHEPEPDPVQELPQAEPPETITLQPDILNEPIKTAEEIQQPPPDQNPENPPPKP